MLSVSFFIEDLKEASAEVSPSIRLFAFFTLREDMVSSISFKAGIREYASEKRLRRAYSLSDNFRTEFSNILLYGDTGVGKTFLSHCIAKELIESSYSVIYFSASMLFDLLAKETFSKKEDAEADTHTHIYDCDLLIIDDLGSELSNAFTTSQLFTVLNERILRENSTIISTNLALEDIKAIYSERIFSRISSSYTMLRLTGDDIRIQKKLLNLGGTNDATP